ncbi:MAG: energy-coupling factor transporter transmembrane component T [Candidatus Caldarchaeum sp.]|nr:energy-coupling factor transporter transmembrane component T [Candidatus Caldarchaeum sp.]
MKKTLLGYLAEDSPIQILHPLTKVLILLVLSAYPMLIDTIEINLAGSIIMLVVMKFSRVELLILKQYKTILVNLLAIIAIAYTFFGGYIEGYRVLATLGPIIISWENLRWAITVYAKLVFAVLIVIFFLSTSRERDVIVALRTLKLPFAITYAAGLGLRSIGLSLIDFFTIREAERARALDLSELPFIQKVKKFGLYIVPMTALVLRRAEEVSNALDSRGFSLKETRRTDYVTTKYKFRKTDALIIGGLSIGLMIIVVLRLFTLYLNASQSILYSF